MTMKTNRPTIRKHCSDLLEGKRHLFGRLDWFDHRIKQILIIRNVQSKPNNQYSKEPFIKLFLLLSSRFFLFSLRFSSPRFFSTFLSCSRHLHFKQTTNTPRVVYILEQCSRWFNHLFYRYGWIWEAHCQENKNNTNVYTAIWTIKQTSSRSSSDPSTRMRTFFISLVSFSSHLLSCFVCVCCVSYLGLLRFLLV